MLCFNNNTFSAVLLIALEKIFTKIMLTMFNLDTHYGFNELSFTQVMFELFNNTRADATSRVKTPSGAHELTHNC
jgi:hypothetical protein